MPRARLFSGESDQPELSDRVRGALTSEPVDEVSGRHDGGVRARPAASIRNRSLAHDRDDRGDLDREADPLAEAARGIGRVATRLLEVTRV